MVPPSCSQFCVVDAKNVAKVTLQPGEAHFAAGEADPEEPVMLTSATLAAEINRFVDDLQETRRYTGVAAFMVFALLKQLRVFVWYGSQRQDIIAEYAPWASTQIQAAAPFEAIACRLTMSDAGVASHHIVEDPRVLIITGAF